MSEITLQLSEPETSRPPGAEPAVDADEILRQIDQLSADDTRTVWNITEHINLHDPVETVSYGKSAQDKIKSFTGESLQRTTDLDTGQLNGLLTEMYSVIQAFDNYCGQDLRPSKWGRTVRAEYQKTQESLDRVHKQLSGCSLKLRVDIKTLERVYQDVISSGKELQLYIAAGQHKLTFARSQTLSSLRQRADSSHTEEDLLQLKFFEDQCEFFSQRLQDLQTSKTICLQTAVQIRLLQKIDQQLVLSIDESLNSSIAIWQQSLATALTAQHFKTVVQTSNAKLLTTINHALDVQKERCQESDKITLTSANQQTS